MSIWELSKEYYNWESPIKKIYGDIHNEIIRQDEENYMCAIKQAIGYEIDKEELIRALHYDREQYDKGYNDGAKETFIKELEKIREEIKTNRDEWIKGQDAEWHTYDRCIYIIGNHIEELKGEEK